MVKIKNIRKIMQNKKGELSFVFVFAMIFIFWLILLVIDLFKLTSVYLDSASMMREVVEIVSNQGGVSPSVPNQYPSQSTYVNSKDLTKFVHNTMLDAGVEDGDIYILETEDIDGNKITNKIINEGTNIEIDYGKPIKMRLRYKVNFISLPDNSTLDNIILSISRKTTSKYKHRNGKEWEGDVL